jgi:hypothetical protein
MASTETSPRGDRTAHDQPLGGGLHHPVVGNGVRGGHVGGIDRP